ncbi:MAG: gluconeogenesis factor YvcK family protein [Myxococcota bacterium]
MVRPSLEREYGGRARRGEGKNELLRPSAQRPTRIVCMGGGTGLPVVLRGLAGKTAASDVDPGVALTAVVAMSDDGGSSGRLRRTRGMLPPGDVRNCLVALARAKNTLRDVFQYRFGGERGLGGHAVGNLLLAALAELKGDFLEAVRLAEQLLEARGKVLPCTLAPVQLLAQRDDDSVVVGERHLARGRGRVVRVELLPRAPPPVDGILQAIAEADLIAIGPGSLYSSVLPNLLVSGVAAALRSSRGLKVLVSNLMTQPGETDGMSCADHVRAIVEHAGPVLDVVLCNCSLASPELLARYIHRGAQPVVGERAALLQVGVIPVEADLLKTGPRIRHDGRKVARCLLKLARVGV